jgi:protoporphyrinogen IX oxidase
VSEPEGSGAEKATSAPEGRKAARRAAFWIVTVVVLAVLGILFQPPWLYDWLKVLHVVALISWMVGLFYLPRLFVYHSDCELDSETDRTFVVMESRLLKVIMTPAMVVTWGAGLMLAWLGFGFIGLWLWLKIGLVVGLTGFHHYLGASARRFAAGERPGSARQWRMRNEIPTLLMIGVIILVIIKPFS